VADSTRRAPSPPVCVLGVGRSGTSLATQALGLLGVDLGPEKTMLEANDLNPHGFWEQREVVRLNQDILAALGGPWWDPVPHRPGWERLPAMERFRARVEDVVDRHFSGVSRWAIKDPRLLFTLPLWRSVVGEMDCVVCVRNPLEVAASGDRSAQTGQDLFALWVRFNCEAIRTTSSCQRTFVFYDDWFVDPQAVGRELARFVSGADDEFPEHLTELAEPGLHRNRASEVQLAESDIALETRTLYFLLRELARAEARGDEARVRALEAVSLAMDGYGDDRH
jgi:hypothetical protein